MLLTTHNYGHQLNINFSSFTLANVSMILLKSTVLASSDSMLKRLSATRHSCVELFLSLFLTKLNLLNERSADATVTGSVRNILSAIHIFDSNPAKFTCVILFSKSNGFISLLGLILLEWICLRRHASLYNAALSTSSVYIYHKICQYHLLTFLQSCLCMTIEI